MFANIVTLEYLKTKILEVRTPAAFPPSSIEERRCTLEADVMHMPLGLAAL